MLRVRVKYISLLVDVVGLREEFVEVREGTTLGELINLIYRKHPKLGELGERFQIIAIVNDLITDHKKVLNAGDEVTVIPPAAGG